MNTTVSENDSKNIDATILARMFVENGDSGLVIAKHLKSKGFSAEQTMEALQTNGFNVEKETAGWGTILHIENGSSHKHGELLGPLSGHVRELAWRNK